MGSTPSRASTSLSHGPTDATGASGSPVGSSISHQVASGAVPVVTTVPVVVPPLQSVERVSTLTDELLTVKAKLALAEQKLRDQKAGSPGVPHTECVLCMDAAVDTVLLPCGHICLCNCCTESLRRGFSPNPYTCPLCRIRVVKDQRIFLPIHQPPPKFAPNRHVSAGQVERVTFSSKGMHRLVAIDARGAERSPISNAWAAPPDPPLEAEGQHALFSKTMPVGLEFPPRFEIDVDLSHVSEEVG